MTATNPIHIVLVQTLYSRNLGSCSRVMANLGGSRLINIDPQCEFNLEARQGASGAQTRLVERTIYKNWDEFFANEQDGLRIAFCGVPKAQTDPLFIEDRVSDILQWNNTNGSGPIYLIFGREDHGLEDVDLEYANHILRLPVYGEFESYNLSHAVMLGLFLFRQAELKIVGEKKREPLPENLPAAELETNEVDSRFQFPKKAIEEWLTSLGFQIGNRRRDVYTVLKRILLSNRATSQELQMLEAIIYQTIRKLKK